MEVSAGAVQGHGSVLFLGSCPPNPTFCPTERYLKIYFPWGNDSNSIRVRNDIETFLFII